jgi:hypothetical protein
MTDNESPKVYGEAVAVAQKAYDEIVKAANDQYYKVVDLAAKPLTEIRSSLDTLFGRYSSTTEAVMTLMNELSNESQNNKLQAAREERDAAIAQAAEVRDAVIEQDPFLHHLHTVTRRAGYDNHVDIVMEHLPLTMDQLKALADDEDWCTDFERLASKATERGALDAGTVTVTRYVSWYDVPDAHNPQHGDRWEGTFTLPAYMRLDRYDTDELIQYAVSTEFRKLSD